MKKTLITATLSAVLLLTGCADNKESPAPSESVPQTAEESGTPQQPSENSSTQTPDGSTDETEFVGGTTFNKSELGSFSYDSVLEHIKDNAENNGLNILAEESEDIRELYTRSLALSEVVFSNGDSFPSENFGGISVNDLPQLDVNGSWYYCSMVTYDSFYKALTEVFTKDAADKMLEMQERSFYEYDGALWISIGTGYIDTKTVHTEYEISEKTDGALDIMITAYLAEDNRSETFDPEKADDYEKQTLHYIMTYTKNGWRVSDFPVYRFSDGEAHRVQITSVTDEDYSNSVFPPYPEIAVPITTLPPRHYETGEEIPVGNHMNFFELDGLWYLESEFGIFDFVIEDDGNIVIAGAEFEDNRVVQALHELYTLEYIGTTSEYGHLFRYGDDILAVMEFPWAKTQSPYFKDTDYDESQFYTSYILEPYTPNDYALTLPVD